jgi:hypothetical protein
MKHFESSPNANGFQGETIVTSNYFQNRLNTHQGYGKLHF